MKCKERNTQQKTWKCSGMERWIVHLVQAGGAQTFAAFRAGCPTRAGCPPRAGCPARTGCAPRAGCPTRARPRPYPQTAVRPLSYGRIAHGAGGCLIGRLGQGRGLTKPCQTHPFPQAHAHMPVSRTHPGPLLLVLVQRLLLYYSCY